MTDAQTDEIEQFSAASREQLEERAAALTAALERHTAALLRLAGGSSEVTTVFALNDEVRASVSAWDDAVFDHTGTFPVAVEADEEDEDEPDDDEPGAEDDRPTAADGPVPISVVSRWDLEVIDTPALLTAARAAHRRHDPSESEADAEAQLGPDAVAQALYAVVHEHGEPWFAIPGVGGVSGHRAYLRRADDERPLEELALDYDEPPTAPEGRVLFSESW